MHVSFDDGEHWQSLQLNLPVVPIHDLVVKDTNLVVATHGRSFWILDDVTPLRQISDKVQSSPAHLFPPRPTIRFKTIGGFSQVPASGLFYRKSGVATITARRRQKPNGETVDEFLNAGRNPPDGVIVTYYLKEQPEGEVKLSFLDANEKEIRSFSSEEKAEELSPAEISGTAKAKELRIPKEAGTNRFVWDIRYPGPAKVDGFMGGDNVLVGPAVPPGIYQTRLTVGDQVYTEAFEIQKDPRVSATQADLEAQCALLLRIRDRLTETHQSINSIRDMRRQIEEWERRTQGQKEYERIAEAGKALKEKLSAIEEELIQVKAKVRQDTLNHAAKLNVKLAGLTGVVASADAAPTKQTYELFEDLSTRIQLQLQRLQELIDTDVKAFNTLIREADMLAVTPSINHTH
jgi:hypothetical protein